MSALVSAAAETSDYFWIDDVFVTGILRTKTEKVRFFFEVKHVFDFVKTTCLVLYHVVKKDVLENLATFCSTSRLARSNCTIGVWPS